MRFPLRASAVALLTSLALASQAAGSTAANTAHCPLTFTAGMFSRPAILFYRGTRTPNIREREALWRFLRCARHPWVRSGDHRVWVRVRAANAARRAALPPPLSSLADCIIARESTWNPQAVNGDHLGLAQWDPNAWATDGGLRYASSPLGASMAEQETVLMWALDHGLAGQWLQWDGC
jgi:hypothetical protein